MIEPKLKSDVSEVIRYSQNIENPMIDKLLEDWLKAKTPLMNKFFNGGVSYRSEEKITFELNDESKSERYDCFIEYVGNLIGWNDKFIRYLQSLDTEEFYQNSLFRDYIMPDNKKIQKGTKIVKSFKYFISDEKLLHDIQSKASEIIQENKVEGYLTFSVHPLDFLSSSENCFNWRSCHSLDGEYRAGNLSYMCDSSTIICYLQTGEDVKLPNFPENVPWNNKKWRMLLHFNTDFDIVFAGRQYPFTSPGALEKIREVMLSLLFTQPDPYLPYYTFSKPKWSHWHNDYLSDFQYKEHGEDDASGIENDKYIVINRGVWNINKIVKDADNSRHFNDIIRSSCYTQPYYMFEKCWYPHHDIKFKIGSEVTCLYCGEHTIDSYDTMMCPNCECAHGNSDSEEYCTCDCCGARFYEGNGYWIGEEHICSNCYETQCFTCEGCSDIFYNDEKYWDEDSKKFLCECCYKDKSDEETD